MERLKKKEVVRLKESEVIVLQLRENLYLINNEVT